MPDILSQRQEGPNTPNGAHEDPGYRIERASSCSWQDPTLPILSLLQKELRRRK
jgi:hypothetical protein